MHRITQACRSSPDSRNEEAQEKGLRLKCPGPHKVQHRFLGIDLEASWFGSLAVLFDRHLA